MGGDAVMHVSIAYLTTCGLLQVILTLLNIKFGLLVLLTFSISRHRSRFEVSVLKIGILERLNYRRSAPQCAYADIPAFHRYRLVSRVHKIADTA